MKGLTTVTMVIVLLQSGIYFDFMFFFSVLQNFLFDEQMENTFFKKLERILIFILL